MGFFGAYVFNGFQWRDADVTTFDPHLIALPHLWVIIHDSDIAHVGYQPQGAGSGEAFLGFTPRDYFEDENASVPTDVRREAAGLAEFGALITRGKTIRTAEEIEPWLARDGVLGGDDEVVFDAANEAEIFVEVKVAQFLEFLGLPLPEGLKSLG